MCKTFSTFLLYSFLKKGGVGKGFANKCLIKYPPDDISLILEITSRMALIILSNIPDTAREYFYRRKYLGVSNVNTLII